MCCRSSSTPQPVSPFFYARSKYLGAGVLAQQRVPHIGPRLGLQAVSVDQDNRHVRFPRPVLTNGELHARHRSRLKNTTSAERASVLRPSSGAPVCVW